MDRNELKKSVVQLANSIEKLITSKDITDFDDYYKNYAKVCLKFVTWQQKPTY